MNKFLHENIEDIVIYNFTMYGLSSCVFMYVLLFCSFHLCTGGLDMNSITGLDMFIDSVVMRLWTENITYSNLWLFLLSVLFSFLFAADAASVLLLFRGQLVNKDNLIFLICNCALLASQYAILLDVYVVYRCMLATLFFLLMCILSAILFCVLC